MESNPINIPPTPSWSSTLQKFHPNQWYSIITETPKATKSIAFTLFFTWLICALVQSSLPRAYPIADIIGLVPGYSFSRLYIWNIITSGFYHAHFIDLVVSVVTLLAVGRYLEPFWGTREFVKYILMVNICGGLGCVAWNTGAYIVTLNELLILPITPYGGFGGVISAFAVAGKQLIPDLEMPILGFIPARVKHMPMVLLLSNALWHLIGLPASSYSFVLTGTITSWVYLRFFQRRNFLPDSSNNVNGNNTANVIIGDKSDTFSFISFFPEPIQPALNKFIFCSQLPSPPPLLPLISRIDQSHLSSSNIPVSHPSVLSEPQDADRRRLKALQQVDARIAKHKAAIAAGTPPQTP